MVYKYPKTPNLPPICSGLFILNMHMKPTQIGSDSAAYLKKKPSVGGIL